MNWEYLGNTSPRSSGVFCLRSGETALFQSYAMAAAIDGRSIDTRRAELMEKQADTDGMTLVFRAANGLVLTETLSFFAGQPCAKCALSDASGAEIETNRLVPMAANAGGGDDGIPLWWNHLTKQLYVPFDNDNWLRYEALPMHAGQTSYEYTMLLDEDSREGLLFGALDFEDWKNGIINNAQSNRTLNCVSGVADLGSHDVCPHGTLIGKSVESSRFIVLYGPDYRDLLEQYGDILASIREPIRWKGGNPFGFNAFAGLAHKMSNEVFDRTGDFLYRELMPRGFQNDGTTYLNLDGGWQMLPAEERMRSKTEREARGQHNGIYDGPFSCRPWGPKGFDAELPELPGHTYAEILLRDARGEPLPPVDDLYAFDVTHPVWRAYTKAKFEQWKPLGYDYLKLDFLTHGCMEGVHYDRSVRTGRQAIHQGYRYLMELIDEEFYGKPLFLSISIAPLFPYGYAHARRSSCDAFGTNDYIEYVLNALTYSWWQNRRLYDFNDADHLVLHRSFNMKRDSTEGEAKARYTTGVISGGLMLLSDDYDDPAAQAKAIRYAGNPEVNALARSRVAFRPVDFHFSSASHAFTAEVDGASYLALFSWQPHRECIEVDLRRAGLKNGVYRDLWTGDAIEITHGTLIWEPEGCDALLLKRED